MYIDCPYYIERVCENHNQKKILKFTDKIVGDDFLKQNHYSYDSEHNYYSKHVSNGIEIATVFGYIKNLIGRESQLWEIEFKYISSNFLEIDLYNRLKSGI